MLRKEQLGGEELVGHGCQGLEEVDEREGGVE